MKAIGIDIGTTSVCGVLIDALTGELIASETKNSNAFLAGCAWWEKIQSVEKIINIATEILTKLLCEDVAVIGVTGQMHGIVYYNSKGNAVSPLYTWQDERGNLPYKDTSYAEYLNSYSGYGNVTDFYNSENGIRPIDAAGYCTIQDYLVMQLCKQNKPLMHSTNAAGLGCYDLKENKFNYPCNADILTDFHIAGEYQNIPVSVAIGDNQASVFSTLADENGILLNVGTGSQVSILSNTPITAENIETRPYFNGKYLAVGSALCGGRAYSLLKDFYYNILKYNGATDESAVYRIMTDMINNTDTASLTVDTRFAGTRSNKSLCGSISNITTENFTPSQLTLGVLNGMASELFTMYKAMNVNRSGIVGSGNGVRKNPALVSALEKTFGTKMLIPNHTEEAATGAALYGLVSCKAFKTAKEAQSLIKYI